MDLILEDIGSIDWVATPIAQARLVTKFFKRHSHAREVLQAFTTKALLLPAETRFGTHVIMMRRLLLLQSHLMQVVVDDRWKDTVWSTKKIRDDAAELTACVGCPQWWEDMRTLCKLLDGGSGHPRGRDQSSPGSAGRGLCRCTASTHICRSGSLSCSDLGCGTTTGSGEQESMLPPRSVQPRSPPALMEGSQGTVVVCQGDDLPERDISHTPAAEQSAAEHVGLACPTGSLPGTGELLTMDSMLVSLPDLWTLISPGLPHVSPPKPQQPVVIERGSDGFDVAGGDIVDMITSLMVSATPTIFRVGKLCEVALGLAETVTRHRRDGQRSIAQRSLSHSLNGAEEGSPGGPVDTLEREARPPSPPSNLEHHPIVGAVGADAGVPVTNSSADATKQLVVGSSATARRDRATVLPTVAFYASGKSTGGMDEQGVRNVGRPSALSMGERSIGSVDGARHTAMAEFEDRHGSALPTKMSDVHATRAAKASLSRARKKASARKASRSSSHMRTSDTVSRALRYLGEEVAAFRAEDASDPLTLFHGRPPLDITGELVIARDEFFPYSVRSLRAIVPTFVVESVFGGIGGVVERYLAYQDLKILVRRPTDLDYIYYSLATGGPRWGDERVQRIELIRSIDDEWPQSSCVWDWLDRELRAGPEYVTCIGRLFSDDWGTWWSEDVGRPLIYDHQLTEYYQAIGQAPYRVEDEFDDEGWEREDDEELWEPDWVDPEREVDEEEIDVIDAHFPRIGVAVQA
ncbi:hypothetical protein CBR_g52347 [Chara braunii]|uniref:Uncharacterized protein n=1 Tax=Chara braunii TaxID=69332 RepID=A0A388K6S1_CHABU|nr:hypothetical protein CBR_g52347 [Chara braunii]|eukprot:GBG65755.1 hypothetical protein CBR_g52347 [Chara braunii]